MSGSLSRRRLLELAGVGGVAAVAAGSGAVLFERRESESNGKAAARAVPFYGPHQAGIVTPQQRHLRFASFDLTATSASEIRDLLATWTAAAARYAVGDT